MYNLYTFTESNIFCLFLKLAASGQNLCLPTNQPASSGGIHAIQNRGFEPTSSRFELHHDKRDQQNPSMNEIDKHFQYTVVLFTVNI